MKYAEHEQETQWEVCEVRGASVPPPRIPLEETLSKWVHDRQQPLSIPALQDDQRFPATTAWLQQHGLQCVCAVPLTTPRRRLGTLAVAAAHSAAYSEQDVAFLTIVAYHVAFAIENASNIRSLQLVQRDLGQLDAVARSE